MNRATTIGLLERCINAFNAGDHAVLLACLADDVAHDVNQTGREIGKEKFRWFLALRARHFRDRLADVVIMTNESGGRAALEFTLRGNYIATADGLPRSTGQEYAQPAGIFLEVDDGLVTRVSTCFNMTDFVAQLARS